MFCPECNHQLSVIAITAQTGRVTLDYCNACAGIWSDQGEVNFIKESELSPLLQLLPRKGTHLPIQLLHCPKDHSQLELLQADSVPRDVIIYRCGVCNGKFFPEGMLPAFKSAQNAKIDYFKSWKIPLHSIYAILLPLLVIVVLGGGLVATIIGVRENTDSRTQAKDIITKPLVIRLSENETLISINTENPSTVKLKYWMTTEEVNEVWVSDVLQTKHNITLNQLEANRDYFYQIEMLEPKYFLSPVYTFSTKLKK